MTESTAYANWSELHRSNVMASFKRNFKPLRLEDKEIYIFAPETLIATIDFMLKATSESMAAALDRRRDENLRLEIENAELKMQIAQCFQSDNVPRGVAQ